MQVAQLVLAAQDKESDALADTLPKPGTPTIIICEAPGCESYARFGFTGNDTNVVRWCKVHQVQGTKFIMQTQCYRNWVHDEEKPMFPCALPFICTRACLAFVSTPGTRSMLHDCVAEMADHRAWRTDYYLKTKTMPT